MNSKIEQILEKKLSEQDYLKDIKNEYQFASDLLKSEDYKKIDWSLLSPNPVDNHFPMPVKKPRYFRNILVSSVPLVMYYLHYRFQEKPKIISI